MSAAPTETQVRASPPKTAPVARVDRSAAVPRPAPSIALRTPSPAAPSLDSAASRAAAPRPADRAQPVIQPRRAPEKDPEKKPGPPKVQTPYVARHDDTVAQMRSRRPEPIAAGSPQKAPSAGAVPGPSVSAATPARAAEAVSTGTPPPESAGRVLRFLAEKANLIPGYRLFTIAVGVNPIDGSRVQATTAELLRALLELLPGGGLFRQALDAYGVVDRAAAVIDREIAAADVRAAEVGSAFGRFVDSLSLSDLWSPDDVWERGKAILAAPARRIVQMASRVAAGLLEVLRDALRRPLSALAGKTPWWGLLCGVLGQDPITGEPVARDAEALIGGFMRLIGQEEIWQNIRKANAVARAQAWFWKALDGLTAFVKQVPGLIREALASLEIADVVLPPLAYVKVGRAFAGVVVRFASFAGDTIWDLLEIVFSAVAPGVMVYLRKAAGALRKILKDPLAFVKNLVAAGKQGFVQFAESFPAHLKKALLDWLMGSLADAKIYIPQALTLAEIGKLVMSVLGVTWGQIRAKIVKALGPSGEKWMSAAEKTLEILAALREGGLSGVWKLVEEKLADLREQAIGMIVDFVKSSVVGAAVKKIVGMLVPGGAFLTAILTIYDAVMVFVERLRQIAAVVAAFIDSLAAIADGQVGGAANHVEKALAGTLSVVIAFFARFAGLGKVSDFLVDKIRVLRGKVDQAIEKGIVWIVEKAKKLGGAIYEKTVGAVVEWWRAKQAFVGADGAPHSVYFSGKGPSARVIVASDPLEIEKFLDSIEGKPDYVKAPRPSLIKELRGLASKIQRARASSDEKSSDLIKESFAGMAALLQKLVGAGAFATKEHPLPIAYPKRRGAEYPEIYIGPRSKERLKQEDLRDKKLAFIEALISKEELDEWKARNGKTIVVYRPTARADLPGGPKIGIDEHHRTEPGKTIKLDPKETEGGALINKALEPFGFRADEEKLDGDHLIEMQLGGPNELRNLWPLRAGENRSSGAKIKGMTLDKPDGTKIAMDDLKERAKKGIDTWLIITSTRPKE